MRESRTRLAQFTAHGGTVGLAALSLLVGVTTLASANDVVIEHPVMYFGFAADASSTTICGNGSLRAAPSPNPTWSMEVAGARMPGLPVVGTASAGGESGSVCIDVPKNGAAAGSYDAVFRFLSVPSSDKPAAIAAHVVWHPASHGEIVATEQ